MKAIFLVILTISMLACSSVQRQEQLKEELIQTDLDFSEMSLKQGMNSAFAAFVAEDGVLLRPGSMPITGKTSIEELLLKVDDTSFHLTWEPLYARVAASGDLGYTYGVYKMQAKSADTTLSGTYVSIWIQEEGEWKWVLDTGNEGAGD